MALNKNHYILKMNNATLYGIGILSTKIVERRLRLAGHAARHPELTLNKVLLWEPLLGIFRRGRPKQTFLDVL